MALGHSECLDLLPQHAKAAIAQKFALTAEHRRGGQRDQPAPIKPGDGPFDGDARKGFPLAKHAEEFVAAIQSDAPEESFDRLAVLGRVGSNRGDEHGIRRAKAALLVEGPQEARLGDGVLSPCGAGSSRKSGADISSGCGILWSFAGAGGSSLTTPRAGADSNSHVAPPGPAMRTQRKLTPIGRRSTTRRICSRRGSPMGSVAARWRRRRADGPSARTSRASSASQSLAPNRASMDGLALTTRPGGDTIASRALALSHSFGASSRAKAAAPCARDCARRSAADDGGEWVKVGAREWTQIGAVASPTIRALSLAKA